MNVYENLVAASYKVSNNKKESRYVDIHLLKDFSICIRSEDSSYVNFTNMISSVSLLCESQAHSVLYFRSIQEDDFGSIYVGKKNIQYMKEINLVMLLLIKRLF